MKHIKLQKILADKTLTKQSTDSSLSGTSFVSILYNHKQKKPKHQLYYISLSYEAVFWHFHLPPPPGNNFFYDINAFFLSLL